jgi:hypothetical protein
MSKVESITEKFTFEGVECSLANGKIARRSNASVEGRMGGTVVLATVDVGSNSDGFDYFPLSIEYIEIDQLDADFQVIIETTFLWYLRFFPMIHSMIR